MGMKLVGAVGSLIINGGLVWLMATSDSTPMARPGSLAQADSVTREGVRAWRCRATAEAVECSIARGMMQ